MEQYSAYLWLAVIVVSAVVEGLTAQLVGIWFCVGGLGGLIASLVGAPLWLQGVITVVVSLIALVGTRPFVIKLIKPKKVNTNADRAVGGTAVVTAEINNMLASGLVNLSGSIWTARSISGEIIPVGQKVRVERIEGVKLMVSALPEEKQN